MIEQNVNLLTSEQEAAIKYAEENIFPIEILSEVAKSIPQKVPNGTNKKSWGYGSCRIIYMIGGHQVKAIEDGTAPSDIDLSDIKYIGWYRQCVRNRNTGVSTAFVSLVGNMKENLGKVIRPGWKREEVESEARKSFLDLQKMCKEYYDS